MALTTRREPRSETRDPAPRRAGYDAAGAARRCATGAAPAVNLDPRRAERPLEAGAVAMREAVAVIISSPGRAARVLLWWLLSLRGKRRERCGRRLDGRASLLRGSECESDGGEFARAECVRACVRVCDNSAPLSRKTGVPLCHTIRGAPNWRKNVTVVRPDSQTAMRLSL